MGGIFRMSKRVLFWIFSLVGALIFVYFSVHLCKQAFKPALFIFRNTDAGIPCAFQQPDPFDPTIAKFIWTPKRLECAKTPSLVSVDANKMLLLNVTVFNFFGIKQESDILCEMRSIVRHQNDETLTFSKATVVFLPTKLTSDFTRVTCKTKNGDVLYDNIVLDVIPKKNYIFMKSNDTEKLNVVVFGLDSVSRAASIRHLPKTRAMLRSLGAYDFEGYMKVGDNTAPNVIPLLTGKRLGSGEFADDEDLDSFPFLWKQFAENGYRTLKAEDMPHISPFNNRFRGFRKPPTDHYMRPFWLALKQMDKFKDDMSSVYRFLEAKGINMKESSAFCHQNTKKHVLLINYIRQFFMLYKNKPKFSYTFLTELSHSYTNFLTYGDEDFAELFHWFNVSGILNKTVLIVFGDHGPRYEHYRNTFVGRIESRMPFLSIVVPEQLKQNYNNIHKSLDINRRRLVTLFDVHQTIKDVLNSKYEYPSKQYIKGGVRGVSLFQPLSNERSCLEAAVPEEYCACYKSTALNLAQNSFVKHIGQLIVKHINNLLTETDLCEQLKLTKMISVRQLELGLEHKDTVYNKYSLFRFSKPEKGSKRYSVTIETEPGHAQFDATCDFSKTSGLKVIGEIERVNKYGNQSVCIYKTHVKLRQYCYCK